MRSVILAGVPTIESDPASRTDCAFVHSGAGSCADQAFFQNGSGCDVSHKGGPPSFVQQPDVKTLVLPDYTGNNMFNTLGNPLESLPVSLPSHRSFTPEL
jgi:hypothetical protein